MQEELVEDEVQEYKVTTSQEPRREEREYRGRPSTHVRVHRMAGVREEGQDDQQNRCERPQAHICFGGVVPKMCPKKIATRGLKLVLVAPGGF